MICLAQCTVAQDDRDQPRLALKSIHVKVKAGTATGHRRQGVLLPSPLGSGFRKVPAKELSGRRRPSACSLDKRKQVFPSSHIHRNSITTSSANVRLGCPTSPTCYVMPFARPCCFLFSLFFLDCDVDPEWLLICV